MEAARARHRQVDQQRQALLLEQQGAYVDVLAGARRSTAPRVRSSITFGPLPGARRGVTLAVTVK